MSNNEFIDCRPTALEEEAYRTIKQHFAEHLKQLKAARDAIQCLERSLIVTAAEMFQYSASPVSADERPPQIDNGEQWHKSVDLVDNCYACHRSTGFGSEFAVVEQTPPNQIDEVLVRGRNPVEVLRRFGRDQRQALQLWTDDVAAQVKEQLVEKYPGQDLHRVADAIVHRFTQLNLARHVIKPNAGQVRSRGIRI